LRTLCAVSVFALPLAVLTALPGTALAASLNFVEPASSPEATGAGPHGVAIADLDGDGDKDLAVVNLGGGNVTILKNNGNGNFHEPASSPEGGLGSFPDSIVAADLDGDGDQDLAIANQESDNVTILKNKGTGNFHQPGSSPEAAGDAPVALTAANLDGVAGVDLAVANATSSDITILNNNGTGNFRQPASSPETAATKPVSVAAADLDGDSDQDLAVAEQQSASLRILLNDGTGNFTEATTSPVPTGFSFPQSIAIANLDGDGDQDLAVAHQLTPNGEVTIFKNNGAGAFDQAASSPEAAGNQPLAIVAADFDLVTGPDLAVVNGLGGNVTILGNNGLGNFIEPASSPETVGTSPNAVAADDLDGDGDPDLAVTNANGASVTILKNR
jgi:hypothetical protein